MTKAIDRVLASRHADTLRGRLIDLDDVRVAHVHLVVSEAAARSWTGQLLAVQVANLIGRLEGVVATVGATIDGGNTTLYAGIEPREADHQLSLLSALATAATLASPQRWSVVAPESSTQMVLRVGIGAPTEHCDLYVSASAWGAYVGTRRGPDPAPARRGSIGAFVAASLGAGEVFRQLRITEWAVSPEALFFDAWAWCVAGSLEEVERDAPNQLSIHCPALTLAGVGAVGSAIALILWASGAAVTADMVDGDIIGATNLNRYVLFGQRDLGENKAMQAALTLEGSRRGAQGQWNIRPCPEWWAEYARKRNGAPVELILSAVDTNVARHQLQDGLPRLIIGASTNGLRAAIGRYDLASEFSRCLKCFNAIEQYETDRDVQRRLLALGPLELAHEAHERGLHPDQLRAYVEEVLAGRTGCAILAGPNLDRLRRREGEGAFAVSFVSTLAGAMLAAQLMRESVGEVLLSPPLTRANFQFWQLDATETNRVAPAPRDPTCWCARPSLRQTFAGIWSR